MVNAGNGPEGGADAKVLIILDGASEPLREYAPTALERAETPILDALATAGTLTRVKTTPAGLLPGSEVAIPTLLGWTPRAAVDRGDVEAAAHGIDVPAGARAWRVDVRCSVGGRASVVATRRAADALNLHAPDHSVHALGGHRLLLVGPSPLPDAALARGLRAWPEGVHLPPGLLDRDTVVVAARGACAGVARRLGATVVHPDGATGDVDTDLRAKAARAIAALDDGAPFVVVHVGGADEAAHRGDDDAKVAFLERTESELIAPLADATRAHGATLQIQPDHGCDPRTGAHDAEPVPCLTWTAADRASGPPVRLTERAVAQLAITDLTMSAPGSWPPGPTPDRHGPPGGVSA